MEIMNVESKRKVNGKRRGNGEEADCTENG